MDAIHSGTLDGGHGVAAYWFGKNVGTSLFGTGPAFDLMLSAAGWIHYGGGSGIYNELIQKILKLDVQSFSMVRSPPSLSAGSRRPITNPGSSKG